MESFKTTLGQYKALKTQDGHWTLYSEYFDENCHSTAGAYEETLHNYVFGCDIPDKSASASGITILEIGHGLGLGLMSTREKIKGPYQFISTELDEELVLWCFENVYPASFKKSLKKIKQNDLVYYQVEDSEMTYKILIGDARKTIPLALKQSIITYVDAIYQDPFSPKKNPTLWTLQWFRLLKTMANKQTIMTTYSASTSIRKAMVEAGWYIKSAPGFGPKRSMTKAYCLQSLADSDLCDQLKRSRLETPSDTAFPPF